MARRGAGGWSFCDWIFADPAQLQSNVARRLETLVRIFLQTGAHNALEGARRQGLELANWRWVFFQDGAGHADLALAFERALARGHFVKDRAQREHIRARVRFLTFNLFGGHVLN